MDSRGFYFIDETPPFKHRLKKEMPKVVAISILAAFLAGSSTLITSQHVNLLTLPQSSKGSLPPFLHPSKSKYSQSLRAKVQLAGLDDAAATISQVSYGSDPMALKDESRAGSNLDDLYWGDAQSTSASWGSQRPEMQTKDTGASSGAVGAGALAGVAAAAAGVAAAFKSRGGLSKEVQKASPSDCTLLLSSCPSGISENSVRFHFRELGENAIVNVKVKKGSSTGSVEFRTPELARRASQYAGLKLGKEQCAHSLGDKMSPAAQEAAKEARSVVHGQCPSSISDSDIVKHYMPLGEDAIDSIRWATDTNGAFKGYGVVEFKSPELANRALTTMPPLYIGGRTVVLGNQVGAKARVDYRLMRAKAKELIDGASFRKRRFGGNSNSQDVLNSISPVRWTDKMLASMPFKRDFSHLLFYESHGDEEVAAFMGENNIRLENCSIKPISNFSEVNFGHGIMHYLTSTFEAPSPIQRIAWPVLLSGRDTVGLAQTGSGKTLGFGLPVLMHIKAQKPVEAGQGPIALILAPTRELVRQSFNELQRFENTTGMQVGMAYGGQDGGANKYEQGAKLCSGCEIVVATPGRLIDFLESGVVPLDRVTLLVLDEADQMLDMGFEPQIRTIISQLRPDRQTLMFSATWNSDVQSLAFQFMKNPAKVVVNNAEDLRANTDIDQQFIFHEQSNMTKEMALLKVLQGVKENLQENSKTLIFVEKKRHVDFVVQILSGKFRNVYGIHGDIAQGSRERALAALREDPHGILVATDVVSRGLDIKNLACVINLEMPKDVSRYIHRIGRTGRAGKVGLAISFMTMEDAPLAPALVRTLNEAGKPVPPELTSMGSSPRPASSRPTGYSLNNLGGGKGSFGFNGRSSSGSWNSGAGNRSGERYYRGYEGNGNRETYVGGGDDVYRSYGGRAYGGAGYGAAGSYGGGHQYGGRGGSGYSPRGDSNQDFEDFF